MILRKKLLSLINRFGQAIPKRIQRRIADFPGILKLFEKLSNNELMEIPTPEGFSLVINPLFHYNLVHSGDLRDYEPGIRKVILKFTRPGMVAYDIGANVGIFSFLFASIVGDEGFVYSFEPEENNYSCLEKSLKKHAEKNIILDKRAVGKSEGTENFDRRGGAFSGRLVGDALYESTGNIRIVETVSLDYVVKVQGYRIPDILKIDVEGNEGMVMEGMKNILNDHDPMVICELHSHLGESSEQVTDLLSFYGYSIFDVNDALTDNYRNETASNTSEDRHIIAIKRPKKK